MAQENLTQNTATDATKAAQAAQQFSFGGMDQVSCGPAGLLYTLSNQLIMVYNELQDLYAKVAIAETNVQQSTIVASAAAQRQAAQYQAVTIGLQAGEAFAGAAVTIASSKFEKSENSAIDTELESLGNQLQPLKVLDAVPRLPEAQANPMVGDVQARQVAQHEVTARTTELLGGNYGGSTDAHNKAAISESAMTRDQFIDFKKALNKKISDIETNINTKTSQRMSTQTRFQSYGGIVTQGSNTIFKGVESNFTAKTGQEQATSQVANGVNQMANGTADSARGTAAQYYAKESDVIAAARQGANANAQL